MSCLVIKRNSVGFYCLSSRIVMAPTREDRALARATIKRDEATASIESLWVMSQKVPTDASLIPVFVEASKDVDLLWSMFETENDAELDTLIELDKASEFSVVLGPAMRQKCAIISAVRTPLAAEIYAEAPADRVQEVTAGNRTCAHSSIRLPEIPLPRFSGDLASWPIFSDRFLSLIAERPQL